MLDVYVPETPLNAELRVNDSNGTDDTLPISYEPGVYVERWLTSGKFTRFGIIGHHLTASSHP